MDYCIRASDAAVANRRLAIKKVASPATATNGKPCSARPPPCDRCETTAQREARKAEAAAAAARAKATHEKIEIKMACFDKAEAACHASRAHCTWDAGGCFALFSATERAETQAWTRRI